MSRNSLAKKLLPAKKAWKNFKTTLQSKLQKLKFLKTIKLTTKNSSNPENQQHMKGFKVRPIYIDELYPRIRIQKDVLPNHPTRFLHEEIAASSNRVNETRDRKNSLVKKEVIGESEIARYQLIQDQDQEFISKFMEEMKLEREMLMAASSSRVKETRDRKNSFVKKEEIGENGISRYQLMEDQSRGVDERAEEFIFKFREEMKLERQKSVHDFLEMLNHGA